MQKYEVKQFPLKKLKLFLYGIILVAASAFLVTSDTVKERYGILAIIVGIAGLLVFTAGLIGVARLLFQPYLLLADEYGITDSSALISMGFIPWEEIADVGYVKYMNNHNICITLTNPERYLATLPAGKRKVVENNIAQMKYPIWIALSTAEEKATQIARTVRGFHAEYLKRNGLPAPETFLAWPAPRYPRLIWF